MINFNSGPSYISEEVRQSAIEAIRNFKDGLSILEIGHRTREYNAIAEEIDSLFREIMKLNDDFEILLLQGGATLQFTQIPYNFLDKEDTALYVETGSWGKKAAEEASIFGNIIINKEGILGNPIYVPKKIEIPENVRYIHLTSNETISGTQWKNFSITEKNNIVADMSSDILSRKIDFNRFSCFYAGAQKNLGIAGLTIVFIRKSFVSLQTKSKKSKPLCYKSIIEAGGIPNTPSVFAVYVLLLILRHLKEKGLENVEKENEKKAKTIYDCIDAHDIFVSFVEKESRSAMNVPFFIENKEKEHFFLTGAEEKGFYGIRGHRTSGGIRVSLYNAIKQSWVDSFVEYMKDFSKKYA